MHRIALLIGSCVLFSCSSTPPVVETHTSPAGHTFDLLQMPKAQAVSVRMHWADGWLRDADRNGAVPFLGTRLMLEGGAGDLGAAELGEAFADIGGRGNLYAVVDGVVGALDVRADRVERVLPLVGDVIERPHFDDRWRERIANTLQSDHQAWLDSANGKLNSLFFRLLARDDNLRRAVIVQEADAFGRVASEALKAWREDVFTPAPSVITVAGRLDADKAAKTVDSLLGERRAPALIAPWASSAIDARPVTVVWRDESIDTSVIVIGGQLPLETDTTTLFNRIIALQAFVNGENAPLMRQVRQNLGATYGFSWWLGDAGFRNRVFSFSAEVDSEQLDTVRDVIKRAWDQYRSTGPAAGTVKKMVEGHADRVVAQLRESPATVAQWLLQMRLRGRGVSDLTDDVATWRSVTAETVREALQRDFGSADALLMLLTTPSPDAWPDACEVSAVEQVDTCRVSG